MTSLHASFLAYSVSSGLQVHVNQEVRTERSGGTLLAVKLQHFAIHHFDQSYRVSISNDRYRGYTIIITVYWNSYIQEKDTTLYGSDCSTVTCYHTETFKRSQNCIPCLWFNAWIL